MVVWFINHVKNIKYCGKFSRTATQLFVRSSNKDKNGLGGLGLQ